MGLDPAGPRRPTGLVLAPTRELADQITTEIAGVGAPVGVSVRAVYGGVGYGAQRSALSRGVDVVVACPGRLEDLMARGDIDLDAVVRVVLDEADRLADMGFIPAVRRILDACVARRQLMLFSATLEGEAGALGRRYLSDPVTCTVDDPSDEPDLSHVVRAVDRPGRIPATVELVERHGSTIVFCRTRRGADRVARQLTARGVRAVAIHGNRNQSQRTRALARFTAGDARALVATDVAARGIHVDDVACVVHFDPPGDADAYVHRSGRTGRAGARGTVVSLVVDDDQRRDLDRMLRDLGVQPGATDGPGRPDGRRRGAIPPGPATSGADGGRPADGDRARPASGSTPSVSGADHPGSTGETPERSAGPGPGRRRGQRTGPRNDPAAPPAAPRARHTRRSRPSAGSGAPPGAGRRATGSRRPTLAGSVVSYDRRRGFGFIRHGGGDLFFHVSQLRAAGVDPGQLVAFTVGEGRRGPEARDVAPLGAPAAR